MQYTKFIIENYKGIKHLELDLNILPDNKIYTLVGLNESGKTTILEAIHDFESEVPEANRHLLIPKSAAGGFTGEVKIKATLSFSQHDKERIKKFVSTKVTAKEIIINDVVDFERKYSFSNSLPVKSEKTYFHYVKTKKTSRSPAQNLPSEIASDLWSFVSRNLFPDIIFYRDFLAKFPDKIYLSSTDEKEKEYISIIEDVLTSVNSSYTLQTSLIDRLSAPTNANIQALEAVENEMGAKISKVVFEAWNRIQNVSKKEIVVKTGNENGRYYIKLSVKEGHQIFSVSERSLGFRWFFTFLLYTEFRKERIKTSGEILFLLDEPASNLHQAAQRSLLDTFEKITTKSRLVYTTHSHHLINTLWLGSTYIIKNKGLEYKEVDDFNASKTEVEAYKYKQFVSQYPSETSYFQPILDVLDYKPGLLEYIPNIVITEGKFDFLTLRYFRDVIFYESTDPYSFYPGQGASCLDLPIALYEAWARKYIVLLDADTEGKKQKKRYIEDFSDKDHIFTLEDVDQSYKGFSTEKLFSDQEKIAIAKEFNSSLVIYNKGAFNTGIQILLAEKRIPDYLSDSTKEKFRSIVTFCKSKF